jgi:tRNA pseudouridine38-40 synthase
MRVLRIDLDYDGTDFRGFAPQPGARTVGGELERVLSLVLGEPVRVTPGARTDSGVHAQGQVVSVRTGANASETEVKRALNALVGQDVWVRNVVAVDPAFDARRSARSRRYRYRIWNSTERSVWERRWSVQIGGGLDVDAMHEACQLLLGKHDFAAFRTHRAQDDVERSTVRRVIASDWRRDSIEPGEVTFEIEADAFLRHMVRTIVGSSILVGQGKLPVAALSEMLKTGERAAAGPTAPAQGLTLMEIKY